jgi:uncharacterized radical SAM protein YgiQ
MLPSLEAQQADAEQLVKAHLLYQQQAHPAGRPVLQDQGPATIAIRPPARPLTTAEMDALYALPYTRRGHPRHEAAGGVPALETVRFSLTTHRGCFGGCNFCSIYFHQGKHISNRSVESLLGEADRCLAHPDFRSTFPDLGGPTANMYGMTCGKAQACARASCLFPAPCPHLRADYAPLLELMEAVRRWQARQVRVPHVFVASGVRYDLALLNDDYLHLLTGHFVGGHLKVAPEHVCPEVLRAMGKPDFALFEEFEARFAAASRQAGKEQYLVPYFISAHPGATLEDARRLGDYLRGRGWRVRQVQDYTPIPLSLSAAMFVAGRDAQVRPLYVARGRHEKQLQMAHLQGHAPRAAWGSKHG